MIVGRIIPARGKVNYGQRKPKQYGPLAYVRSCVTRNAEKLGIDPKFLQTILACWEGEGQILHNYGLSVYFNNTDITWDKNNPVLTSGSSYSVSSASMPGLKTEFSCFVGGLVTYYTGNQQRNFFSKPAITAYRFYFAFQYYSTGKLVFTGANYKSVIGTKTHTAGKIITATATRNSESALYLYNNGEQDGYIAGATGSIYDSLEYVGKPSSSYGIDGPLGVIYLLNGCCLNATQIAELSERPYLLLVENRPPIIFDFGSAVSSIPETGAALVSAGGLSIAGQKLAQGSAAVVSASALADAGQKVAFSGVALASNATIAAAGSEVSAIPESGAALDATGGFSVDGQKVAPGSVALESSSALADAGQKVALADAALASAATVTAAGSVVSSIPESGAALDATGGFSVAGQKLARSPTVALSESAVNAAAAVKTAQSSAALAAAAALTADGFIVGSIAVTGPVSLAVEVIGAELNLELINPDIEIEVR